MWTVSSFQTLTVPVRPRNSRRLFDTQVSEDCTFLTRFSGNFINYQMAESANHFVLDRNNLYCKAGYGECKSQLVICSNGETLQSELRDFLVSRRAFMRYGQSGVFRATR